MMNYAQGGLANIAQNLANKGRNGDTELVHMSPREVNGLQTLARANGTSLTMNPNTGLPEAFRLEQFLPMAAGAALTIGSGGALSPLAASLLVGGGYGAATGSIEKGLMAGIGAYGGAGIATGVTGAASQGAIETSATNALGVPAGTPAPTPISPEFTPTDPFLDSVPVTSATPVTPSPSQASILASQNASMGLTPMQSAANISSSGGYAAGATPMPMSSQAIDLGSSGIGNLGTKEGLSAAYKGMPTGTLPATATSLLMAGQQTPSTPSYQEDAYDRRLKGYRLSPNYQPYQAPAPNPYYRPTYAADGGVMNSFDDSSGMDEPAGLAQGNLQKGLFGLGYADGGLSLGGYSDGGRMLKGPGDGMSDSIPGVIGGKQPARLADGEFVVPADVVSHLGNGSTDAGAKKLYSMMDKIRQARTGKKKQAPQVNVDKYLPMGKASGGITGYAEGGSTSNSFSGQSIESTKGINYGYDDIVKQVNKHYENNKSPALVAKSALASGLPENVILSLPGVTPEALSQGRDLIDSGAFGEYNPSEARAPVVAAPTGSTQYDARMAAGLDAYGFTPAEVAYKQSIGQYGDNPLPTLNTVIAPTSVSTAASVPTPTYNSQLADNIQRYYNDGYSGAQIGAALIKSGVSPETATAAMTGKLGDARTTEDIIAQMYAGGANIKGDIGTPAGNPVVDASGKRIVPTTTPVTPVTPNPVTTTQTPVTPPPLTDAQNIKDRVQKAYEAGYSSAQIGAALIATGVNQKQALDATGLDQNTISQIYTGGAALGTNPIGAPAGNFAYKIVDGKPVPNTPTPVTPVTPTPTPLTDAQKINTRVQDAYNKGFSSAQIGAALIRSGVSQVQALQATGLDQNTISQMYTLGAALGNAEIGAPAGNFMFDASGKPITAAQQTAAQQAAAFNEAASKSIAAYRPSFVPRVSGISMSPTMQDPYSNIGLQSLYEQMMGQYKAPTQPMSDADIRTFAQNFARDNPGKGAELGQALINKGIPVNQAIAATGLSPGTLNTAYIGGQGLGTAAPPTLNTQYNYSDPGSYYRPAPVSNLVLKNPITDAVIAEANQAKADTAAAATAKAAVDAGSVNRAGGLMSIDRKKRAKYKK